MRKQFAIICLLLCYITLTSKKCNNQNANPGGANPPPHGTVPTHSVHVGVTEEGLNDLNNGLGYKCAFDIQSFTGTVEYSIWYIDGTGTEVQWGPSYPFPSSAILLSGNTYGNTIQVPDVGAYWIEMKLTMDQCDDCCGYNNIWSQFQGDESGCVESFDTLNLQQGKPSITLASYYDYHSSQSVITMSTVKFVECECNCL